METLKPTLTKNRNLTNLITAAVVGGIYLIDYLDERKKETPIWEYSSRPAPTFEWDKIVRIATNPFMKILADGIVSHHWDWSIIPDKSEYSGAWIDSRRDSFYSKYDRSKLNILHHALAHSIWGVKDAYVLGLDHEELEKDNKKVEGYHYAFQVEGMQDISKSRVFIPAEEKVRVLISTWSLRILALDTNNNELPTIIYGPIEREDPEYNNLRQF